MKSIILDRKTGVSQETSANNFDIGSSKIVILNITKNNILSITQNDNQLVVQLKSGNPIIINDFYGSQNGNNENELVIDDPSEEELGYWWIEEPNSGLNWVHLDDLNPLMITNTSDGISPWIYAAGAGILAAGALAGGGGGGGGGHHHKGQQIATPVVSSNNAEGITGTGTPGWEIVLTKPDNTTEVTTVDENGKWSFNQNGNPLAHGETGKIIARDPQNNDKVSKEVETVADCQPPELPVVEMNNSNGISGTAEPNSTITITNSDGEVVGEAITDANGNWHIEPNPLADGEEGHFTATDKAGNTSGVTNHIADTVAPDAPIVHRNNASGISGTAEPNSKVTVTNSQGQVIGEVITDTEGKWHIEPNPLANGEEGHFTATDKAGNISEVTDDIADVVAPDAPIVEQNNANGISGTAEPNSRVTITNSYGEVVGDVITDSNGNWHIQPNPFADGETGHFTATDKAGNISDVTDDIADVIAPDAPIVHRNNASGISGTAEPNSKVTVTNSQGEVVALVDVDAQGKWHIDYNPLANNEEGHFTATDMAGNTSEVTNHIADTVAPAAPIVEKNNASGISGTAEPNSRVTVTNSQGQVIGEVITDTEGKWHIEPNPLANNQEGYFTATDMAGNTSGVTNHIADTVAPAAPIVEQNNASGISGTAEPNSKVTVTNSQGQVIGEVITDTEGKWHIEPNPLANNQEGYFTATDKAGNISEVTDDIADTVVPDVPVVHKNNASGISGTAEPNSKVIITNSQNEVVAVVGVDANGKWHVEPNPLANDEEGHFTANDKAGNTSGVTNHIADTVAPVAPIVEQNNASGISGTAEPNSKVTVTNSQGQVIGEVITDAEGKWHIEPNPLANDEEGHFTATDNAGNTSQVTNHIADTVAPVAPIVEQNNASGISGTAEPNSKVTVTNSQGEVVALVDVDAQGKWHIDYNPLANNEEGHFTATDMAGNTSEVTNHIADTVAPAAPIVEKNNASGISGTAEPNSKVTITNSQNEVVAVVGVDAEGKWHIDSNPLANDEEGHFTATDNAGNTSGVTNHIADTVAPVAPIVEQNNASGISGTAEPNSKVTITNSQDEVVAVVDVDVNGKWHLDSNLLANGETGHFTATDNAGNTSGVTNHTADTVAPAAPIVEKNNASGISGTAEPNSKVTITNSQDEVVAVVDVDAQGKWHIEPNPLNNNEEGHFTATDNAGNTSQVTNHIADTVAPAAPIVEKNNASGISGMAEPNSKVTITNSQDEVVAVVDVDVNGKWHLDSNLLANGETGHFTATDNAGNTSGVTNHTADTVAPAAPIVEKNNASGISGTAEPNSKVTITNSQDEVVAVVDVDAQGKWHIEPNPLNNNEEGHFTATDNAGNTSQVTNHIADTVAPAAPIVEKNNASGISGTAEPNSKVTITNSQNEVVAVVDADGQGKWHIDSNPLANDEEGHFTATDNAGNTSGVTNHTADTEAPVAPIVEKNNASGISGTAEPNSKVTITNSQDEVVAVVDVDAQGKWHIDSNPLANNEEGHFTATDKAGNTSEVTNHIADTVAPAAPIVEKNNASGISGTAEPNSKVTITNSQDEVVAVVNADGQGKWHIDSNPLANDEEGHFTATDNAGNTSGVTNHIADTVAPVAPIVEQNNASGLSGTAEPNSKVTITNSQNEVVAVVDADGQGKWHIDSNPLANDEEGHFTATDNAGNTSGVTNHTADTEAPVAPIVEKNNASGISGTAEPNSKVTITNSQNEVVAVVGVDAEGKWHIDSNPLANDEEGHFIVTDKAGNESLLTVDIADTVVLAPEVNLNNANQISGTAEPNSKVTITKDDGTVLAVVDVDANGNWHIEPNPLAHGEKGHFTVIDKAGNISAITDSIADTVVPNAPIVEKNNASGISGTAEPHSKVTIVNADGSVVKEVNVDAEGNWHIEPNPLTNGEEGHFTAMDNAGNTSEVTNHTADTVAPDAPIVHKNNASGISGIAEPNSTVIITNSQNEVVGEVKTDAEGKWHIDSNPLAHGETGHFTATDNAGNTSGATNHIADTVAPDAPIVHKNNASGISGIAEPNSTVIITNSQNEVVGEVKTDAEGKWHIDSNPLANNEEGQFIVTDEAGNTSNVTKHTADTEIPDAPIVEQNNASGISGTAEPGSLVIVTDSNGNIAQVVAGEDGSWKFYPNPLSHGAIGTITVTDKAGNISEKTDLGVIDTIVPEAPNVIHSNAKEIYGTSEPNALITIKDRKGNVIETTFADEEGNWKISPNPITTDKTVIRVTATDKAGNESVQGSAMTDLEPPKPPLIDECNADELSGVTEPGSLIYVYDSDGKLIMDGDQPKYAKADPSGIWEFKPNPLGNNPGYIVAMDEAHNVSEPTTIVGTSQYLEDSSLLKSDAEVDDINNHDDQQSISDKVDSDNTVESDNEPKVINVDNHSSSNESEDLNSNELTSDNSQANDNGDIKDQFDLPNESQYLSLDKLLGTVNSDNGNNLDAIDSFTDRHILLINEDVDLTNLNDLLGSSKEAVSFYPENNQLQPESDLVEILDYIQGEQMSMVLETNFDNNELNDIQELEKVMTLKDTDDDILTQLANHQAVI